MPKRIQRKRTKGWRMPPNTKSVTRPGKYSNPARVGMWKGFTQADAVEAYKCWQRGDLAYRSWNNVFGNPPTDEEIKKDLGGCDLACWCKIEEPCHADVLLEIANR